MKLCIPHCKQKMTFVEDCTVSLVATRYVGGNFKLLANKGFLTATKNTYDVIDYTITETGERPGYHQDASRYDITIPKGTVMQISQLYIRNSGWNEDCMNVKIVESPDEDFHKLGVVTFDLSETSKFDVELHEEGK